MQPILLLSGNAAAADRERCRSLVDFLRRRARLEDRGLEDQTTEESAEPADAPRQGAAAESLLRLAAGGLLSYGVAADGTVEVFYTASREAARSLLETRSGAVFPEPVQKKHAAALRSSEGALLRFPGEQEAGGMGGRGDLEVFITDWSPCPAACAVAIHRAHPFAADLAKPDGAWFTGRYVRHPLTGDLLPVWVADWVRPDFGTGAVLVNPAHDATDLAFGRAVGLPIRFALVPAGSDGSPATWPRPPVVKSGQAIRTGPYDGLQAAEAAARYFEAMAERGLAVRHRDIQAGRWKIGRLSPHPEGTLAWHPARHTVLPHAAATAGEGALTVRLDETDLLAAAAAAGPPPVLVCPAGEQAGDLLALRLLAFDLTGQLLEPAAVHLVQKVQETKVEAPPEVALLAALLGAPVQQVAVIKQQTVEQIQRFLRVHRELGEQAFESNEPGAADSSAQRAFAKIKAAVRETDPAKAFSLLLQTQKQLCDLPAEARSGALPGYCVLAAAVTGLEPPRGIDAGRIWSQVP
jgi:leucyl-tRNA synthetase